MIQYEFLTDQGLLVITPHGPLERSDFESLTPAVDQFIEQHGGIRGLLIYVQEFPGWKDFAGLLSHMKFVKDHHRYIRRVAAVTDSEFLSVMPEIARHFVSAEIRHFGYQEKEAAVAWLSESQAEDAK